MKKATLIVVALLVLAAAVRAQTTNSKYEVTHFGAPPPGQQVWHLPRSVAADGKGNILVFRASEPPVLIFNRDGKLQKTWGEGLFPDAHSIDIDREGFLWLTDRDDHMVYKFTMDGKQLMALGTKGKAGDNKSTDAFNGPSDVAVARNGDFFVSDGYFNSRVVHFSKDGKFIKIIGGVKGPAPGQFDLPHGLAIDSKGRLLVLDRQITTNNARVQIFDRNGTFLEQWTDIGGKRPAGIAVAADDTVYIADTDANSIAVLKDGKIIDMIAGLQSRPHNIALDPATGVLYLADPVTPLLAGGNAGRDPNAPGGLIKKVVRK
jgi:DNA-binding beta-propeller fold protein YncE